ncbi:hypothetical protein J6590_100411 [Homalodisca vitripennis]|nr:hypothetical protein J6590_100411 [Homalodisca vitripennis]
MSHYTPRGHRERAEGCRSGEEQEAAIIPDELSGFFAPNKTPASITTEERKQSFFQIALSGPVVPQSEEVSRRLSSTRLKSFRALEELYVKLKMKKN